MQKIDIQLNINSSDNIDNDIIGSFYSDEELALVANQTMATMFTNRLAKLDKLSFPYFPNLTPEDWQKPLELDIYVTDPVEGQQLNLDARGKDYATNILSYPSDLPTEVLNLLPSIPLGELVICHEVVERQAKEQGKTINNHLHHLLVHGILHLLGFDHELGEDERIEMESFEIEILEKLGISNPYES